MQPIYRTMCERPSNALRFRSTVEVDGAIYNSPNNFLPKKKGRIRRYQSCNRTHIKDDKR